MTLLGIAVIAILILTIEPLRIGVSDAVRGDTASLRDEIRDLHFGGVLIVFALALFHVVVWYPAEILAAAAGFVYGFWLALPLVMAGWVVNAWLAYLVGRHAARPLLCRIAGEQRFQRLERVAARGGVTLLLAMRLVPVVPFSLFSIVAGTARVPLTTFLWTTALGYLPLTALFTYLGSQLEELSPTDPILWIGAIALVAMLLLAHRLRYIVREPGPDR
jgi:uncharacterized membrane protein YdjX (TVP38/TMEM64 family)